MNRMNKKFLVLVSILTLLAVIPARAGLQVTDINGGTNNVGGAATKVYAGSGQLFAAHNAQQLGVFISYSVISAGTSNNVVQFSSSVDNSNWVTNSSLMTILSTGTATVRTNFSINTGGIPFWRVESVQNVNAAAITNLTIYGYTKPGL